MKKQWFISKWTSQKKDGVKLLPTECIPRGSTNGTR